MNSAPLIPVYMNSSQDPKLHVSCITPTECAGTVVLPERLQGFFNNFLICQWIACC